MNAGGGWGRWWGPVFEAERVTRARRWQGYALRSFFVLALLAGVALVAQSHSGYPGTVTVRQMARLGADLAAILNVLELVTVLAIAPASTAGAICLDRTRGSLAHLFTTDLSDREIVLGKLAARLGPVLALLAASFPVAALATWLGGIDPVDLLGAAAVVGGLAVLGSTLALMLSVWGQKPQEVLSVVYGIWAAWILALPVDEIVLGPGGPLIEFLRWSNPFYLAMGHASRPMADFTVPSAVFGATCLILGVAFTTVAVRKVRVVACRSPRAGGARSGRRRPAREGHPAQRRGHRLPWGRGPSLDVDPILWRERRRNGGSRWSRWIWRSFWTISALCGVFLAIRCLGGWRTPSSNEAPGLLLATLVVLGFLLVGAAVPGALSDERAQGSLDVLLCAPVSTRSILWAKWRGAFRRVPGLAGWPLVIGGLYLFSPIGWEGRGIALLVPVAIVAQGAAFVSLGLFLATAISRTAVATAWSIGTLAYAVVALPIIGAYTRPALGGALASFGHTLSRWGVAEGSPFFTTGLSLTVAFSGRGPDGDPAAILALVALWTAIYAGLAVGLFELTVLVFDRCLGRMPERSAGGGVAKPTSEAGVGELLEREVDRLAVP